MQKYLAVVFSKQPTVQDTQQAAVFAAADQSSNALAQGDDGLGDLISHERVFPFLAKVIDSGFNKGFGRHGKGEAVDDDAA